MSEDLSPVKDDDGSIAMLLEGKASDYDVLATKYGTSIKAKYNLATLSPAAKKRYEDVWEKCWCPSVDGRNPKEPPQMYKTFANHGVNYQPQLVSWMSSINRHFGSTCESGGHNAVPL